MAKQVHSGSSATETKTSASAKKVQSGQTKRGNRLHENDGWDVFDGYGNAKKQKLDEQFNQGTTRDSAIFSGVAVYVNGYTSPSSDELRRIIQQNGGRYEVYLRKTRVTHIVATNLPNSKYRLAETIPVVRPEWITDSAAAGKRLPHISYLLLGNRSKLQSGLKYLAPVSTAVKTALEYKTSPSAHSFDKSEIRNLKIETVKPDMNCEVKFLPEHFLKDSSSEVKHERMEGKSEIVETNPEQKLNDSDRVSIIIDDDDYNDDVVYNSEEDNNNEENQSRLTVSVLSQNDVSPYKKRSRVYSFRKFRKSDSNTFDAHGADNSTSCDGFIDNLKLGLLDCGEGIGQSIEPSLRAFHLKYNNCGSSSDSVSLQHCLNSAEKVMIVGNKSSSSCLSLASAGALALKTLQPEHTQTDRDEKERLQTERLSHNTESAASKLLNTPEGMLTAVAYKQVRGDILATSSVLESVGKVHPDIPAKPSVLESVEKVQGVITGTSLVPESVEKVNGDILANSSVSESVGKVHPDITAKPSIPESVEKVHGNTIATGLESVNQIYGNGLTTPALSVSKTSRLSLNSTSQVPCSSETSHLSLNSTSQVPCCSGTSHLSLNSTSQVPCRSETSHLSLNSTSQVPCSSDTSHISSQVPCTSHTSETSHLSLNSTSREAPVTSEKSDSVLKPTSNSSSATFLDSTLDQTNSSSMESTHQPSVVLPASTLESGNWSLIQPSHRSSTTSFTSALDPAPPSSKQTFQRSSTTMAKAGDKNFLSEFYSNSRLHHIATWGAEFKAYVSEIQKLNSNSFPGREKLRQLHVENAWKLGQPETLYSARHGNLQKTVMHIDMDCFFVSVGLLARPELKGKPVAVTHSRGQGSKPNPASNLAFERDHWMKKFNSAHLKGQKTKTTEDVDTDDTETSDDPASGTDAASGAPGNTHTFQSLAEIASCSYEARKVGVKNGMFVGTALNLCPGLQMIPYDFSEYNRVSRILYDVVASYTHDIEAVSCDEMLIDCNDVLSDTCASATEFAQMLRAEILEKTGCTSSVGIGPNILLARLATRRAKPNGQFEVTITEAKDFIKDQPVSDLPGVGYSMCRKLTLLEVTTCGDLRKVPLSTLKQEFGPKTGEMLHRFSVGQDSREITGDKQRKSVSAEVNYGIRFSKETEAVTFLQDLSSEVKRRMDAIGVKGRSITLKLMVRRPDAPVETAKFMGHGICNTFNKSSNLPVATSDEKVISREVVSLYRAHRVVASDVRGIGIHINKLERTVTTKGISSGARRSGYQDITSFTVHKTSNTTATTGSALTTTTSTNSVTTTYCQSSPTSSSSVPNPNSTHSSNLPYTTLRSSRRELPTHMQALRFELSNTGSTVSSEPPAKYPRTTYDTQNDSINSNCKIGLQLSSAETCSDLSKNKLVSGTKVNSEKTSSLLQDKNASLQKTNYVAHSKLAVDSADDLDIPGPSWRVDISESRTNHGQKFDGNVSLLSESQIDSDVLDELPAEIAHEILEDLRMRKQQKNSLSVLNPASVPTHASTSRKGSIPGQESLSCAEGAVFNDGLPSLSQLDLNCFHALPLHLQDELRTEYARQEVTSQRSADKKAALAEGNLTHLKSPAKKNLGRQPGLKSSKQPSRRGRQPGKKALNFGNSKVRSSRRDQDNQPDEKPRIPYVSSGEIVWIEDEDASSSSSSRDMYAQEDSSDCHNLPAVSHHPHGSHVQPAANVQKGQAEDRLEDLTFCGASSLDDVRKLIKEWMMSCPEPQDEDVSMVTEYLIKLVQHRNLEQVFSLMRFLTRKSLSQSNPPWKESLFNITTCVQNAISAFYGATLKL